MQAKPFDLLVQLDGRSRDHAATLPIDEEVREEWSGIGFQLEGNHYISRMEEVHEVLPFSDLSLSRVPWVKSWIMGIANVRGNLLPVMDLRAFLTGAISPINRRSRVLVISDQNSRTGILVDDVYGIKHFHVDEHSTNVGEVANYLAPLLKGRFDRADGVWHEFSMRSLTAHSQFLKAAAATQA